MTAEIISVGTELLLGQIVDTHAATMSRILAECGIVCRHRSTVGDNFERLCAELAEALQRADVLIAIGGLGPTMDDLTRDAIAAALGDEMIREPAMEDELRELFARRNLTMSDSILRQADRPASARFIENRNGTAPGLICEKNGKIVIALPGPKSEFEPMADGAVRAFLADRTGEVIHSTVLRLAGIGESMVEDRLRRLFEAEEVTVAPYAQPNGVFLRVTTRASSIEAAKARIAPVVEEIRREVGRFIYAVDAGSVEEALVELLGDVGATVSVAESMTGGELSTALSSTPGASAVFRGGVTAYSIEAKQTLVGVPSQLVAEFGPVSREVAEAMAIHIRSLLGSTFGISVTGNAGPRPDVDGKPVGLVFVGLSGPNGTDVRETQFRVDREEIRHRTVHLCLNWLRDEALKLK